MAGVAKDTALVSLISVNDLMLQTKSIATRTQNRLTGTLLRRYLLLRHYADQSHSLKRIDLRATRF